MKASIAVLLGLFTLFPVASHAQRFPAPGGPTGELYGMVAAPLDEASRDWKPGMGLGLSGSLPVTRIVDLRADWGVRWLEGESRRITNAGDEPRFGGRSGETTEALRVMPVTLDLAFRLEDWSNGRYWVPYVAAGPGFYDMRATFADAAADERNHSLFRFGWHLRGGVRLHRTSGMHLSLETALHFVDTPGKMSPMWEAGFGLGALVPGPSR